MENTLRKAERRKIFTDTESEILINKYATTHYLKLMEMLPGRSRKEITCKAWQLGLSKDKDLKPEPKYRPKKATFTEGELVILVAKYKSTPFNILMKDFPNHTTMQIISRAKKLGLKKSDEASVKKQVIKKRCLDKKKNGGSAKRKDQQVNYKVEAPKAQPRVFKTKSSRSKRNNKSKSGF